MLFGLVPFKAPNLDELHKLILAGEFKIPDTVSEEATKILNGMIKLEPNKRITIPQILAHPWLKETNEMDSESEDEEEKKKAEENKDSG